VLLYSSYGRLPYGPTPVGLGRVVMTPRINARRHAAHLEHLRALVNDYREADDLEPTGIRVLSWARSYGHNRAVGGARDSQHLYFLATDIAREEIRRLLPFNGGPAVFDRLLDQVFARGGVGYYAAGNRHCDSRGRRARWTVA
jgi:uncharacterized protein YcbK (DUF882 family)